jgi:hypothetical protein
MRTQNITLICCLFCILRLFSGFAYAVVPPVPPRPTFEEQLISDLNQVEEFRWLKKRAQDLGLRIWLSGESAMRFANKTPHRRYMDGEINFFADTVPWRLIELSILGPDSNVKKFGSEIRDTFPMLLMSKSSYDQFNVGMSQAISLQSNSARFPNKVKMPSTEENKRRYPKSEVGFDKSAWAIVHLDGAPENSASWIELSENTGNRISPQIYELVGNGSLAKILADIDKTSGYADSLQAIETERSICNALLEGQKRDQSAIPVALGERSSTYRSSEDNN